MSTQFKNEDHMLQTKKGLLPYLRDQAGSTQNFSIFLQTITES